MKHMKLNLRRHEKQETHFVLAEYMEQVIHDAQKKLKIDCTVHKNLKGFAQCTGIIFTGCHKNYPIIITNTSLLWIMSLKRFDWSNTT